jgi:Tol biopolymer transport system component
VTPVPPGRIVFHRRGPGEVEHYFTIATDGTGETPIYEAEGCGCAHLSADGTQVLSIGPTGHGTWSLMTLDLDGSNRTVVDPPIETLNLFIGASSANGQFLAFNGMDETIPANTGLWIASPTLEDARQVTPLLEGWLTIEPFGVTPDGSKIVFFAETGPIEGATHGGDLYVINADGSGLRQLNPPGPHKPAYMGLPVISLSPDGSRAAFGVDEAVWVVELAGGEAQATTPRSGFVWAVAWSPTGEWLAYTRLHDRTPVVGLVRPDGSDDHEISAIDETDQANAGVWSPDGDYLLVRRDRDATTDELNDLWIMGLDGTWIGQVTDEPSSYGTYWWAPAPGS